MKITKKTIISLCTVAVVAVVAVVLLWPPAASDVYAQSPDTATHTLSKTAINQSVSVSGVVESENSVNIYSTETYPVKEIYVSVGDRVKAGDILAELDMTRLMNDIAQTEVNLTGAVSSSQDEQRQNNNSIANAQLSLEASQISLAKQQLSTANAENDLREAEAKMTEAFDSYTYDLKINEAKITLDRKAAELQTAQQDVQKAINDRETAFDDYTYQNTITEARITLARKQQELTDAKSTLKTEKSRDHGSTEADEDAVKSAEKSVTTAENAVNDAQRSLDKAVSDMERARTDANDAANDAVDAANEKLTSAQRAYDDALLAYENALTDKTRAIDTYNDDNQTKLESTQKTYADSQKQLQSAQNSLSSAQNSLDQTLNKPASAETNVTLQELNLEKLNKQLADGKIVATADGVITEINAKVGASPSGVLFVIEDTENLYVSAKVKEYSLSSLELGQPAHITTDATGDTVYEGVLTYISPKAVSAAGSTSVEFEIHAGISEADPKVKIGMNAFLSIVTVSKQDVYAVPLSMVVTNENGSFVYAEGNEERVEIPVTTGIKTSTSVEISGEGLYDGLELLTDPNGTLNSNPPQSMGFFGRMGN